MPFDRFAAQVAQSQSKLQDKKSKVKRVKRLAFNQMTRAQKREYRRKLVLAEIRRAQSTPVNAIPFLPFYRLVKQVTDCYKIDKAWSREAMLNLREVAQDHITQLFEAAQKLASHAGRETVMLEDIQMVCSVKPETFGPN